MGWRIGIFGVEDGGVVQRSFSSGGYDTRYSSSSYTPFAVHSFFIELKLYFFLLLMEVASIGNCGGWTVVWRNRMEIWGGRRMEAVMHAILKCNLRHEKRAQDVAR